LGAEEQKEGKKERKEEGRKESISQLLISIEM